MIKAAAPARIEAEYLQEPMLSFAGDRTHVDCKSGIAQWGPASLGSADHPSSVQLGFVGSGRSIEAARDWFEHSSGGVSGVGSKKRYVDFPGCKSDRGYFTEIVQSDSLLETITAHDIANIKRLKKAEPRFSAAVELVSEKLRLLSERDHPPDIVILALPDELTQYTSKVKFYDPERGEVYRNLRRALKAELMRYRIPTQILLQRVTEAQGERPKIDHPSRVAWNLYTSLFYKAGGVPWKPVGLRPDTCYIGLSFHRPLGSTDHTLRTSVAQAFDQFGVGLILRGPDFKWDSAKHGPSPHLDAERSRALMELALRRYRAEAKRAPARVVIHKTSRYWPDEKDGFQDALKEVAQFDLVAVAPTSEVRLVRAGNYPPLRGTVFSVGDVRYLYTTGYIPALRAYPHGHVPAPVEIADHHGDSALSTIAEEILLLSKMNWNSAGFCGALPITIRFSRGVGDIMREIPLDREPMPQFKFYS